MKFTSTGILCIPLKVSYLSGIRGFVYGFISDVEVQIIHPLHHPTLGLVPDLGRLFDGDT